MRECSWKRTCLLPVFFLFFFMAAALALTPAVQARAYDYTIEGYQVDMKVTKQNIYQIEETITVNFDEPRHGIYRDIPVVNNVKRSDGSTDRITAKVQNITCSDTYEVSREGDNCEIKIGDEDVTLTGEKVYHITYDYVMGNDVLPDEDELYYNVIGTGWQTTIKNVSFQIQMPSDFDEQKIGMSYGGYGDAKLDGLNYYVSDRTIYGELDSDVVLDEYEGVNVRVTLPDGYFESADHPAYTAFAAILLAVITVGVAFLLWWTYGRDDPVVETVEFYPPDGLNSVDLAFAYNGSSSSRDVTSLIVYLAQRGYLEIQPGEGKKAGKNFVLVRKRAYNGFNEVERIFMEGLFAKSERVEKKDLENSFYKTVNRITSLMNNKKNKEKIFYANSLNKGWILWVLSCVTCVLAGFVPVKDYMYSFLIGLAAPLGCGVLFMLSSLALFSEGKLPMRILSAIIFAVAGTVGYFMFLYEPFCYESSWYFAAYIMALAAAYAAMFFNSYLSKRTPYGTEMLGRIRGFKRFLETAEKDRLETLVAENPQYFYDILPYTYVLSVSDVWMKKFESIAVEPPAWYGGSGYDAFDMLMFSHFMNNTMASAATSMVSSPSQSSGGGFSGGGSGGGGGGSW